jgi:L-threonylcarbamoyladenylate synthase
MDLQAEKAAKILADGGIVIFPTDTAFGIGCRMDRQTSVDTLYSVRKRPVTQASPVLVSSVEMAEQYFHNPDETVQRLMETYWPGALTIIAPCNPSKVYETVRGGTETIGLRMPDHPDLLDIISYIGAPVLGPSANFHGEATPYALDEVDPTLMEMVDYVLPGTCKTKLASTVVSAVDGNISVIRQGAIHIT